MNEEQLIRALRELDSPVTPDPAFADRLYRELRVEARRRRSPGVTLLAAAALLAAALIGGMLVVGGRPDDRVVVHPTSRPSATHAVAPSPVDLFALMPRELGGHALTYSRLSKENLDWFHPSIRRVRLALGVEREDLAGVFGGSGPIEVEIGPRRFADGSFGLSAVRYPGAREDALHVEVLRGLSGELRSIGGIDVYLRRGDTSVNYVYVTGDTVFSLDVAAAEAAALPKLHADAVAEQFFAALPAALPVSPTRPPGPTPVPTPLVLTDAEPGYSVTLPAGWSESPTNVGSPSKDFANADFSQRLSIVGGPLTVMGASLVADARRLSGTTGAECGPWATEETQLGGEPAVEARAQCADGQYWIETVVIHGDQGYRVTLTGPASEVSERVEMQALFREITDSFGFVREPGVPAPSPGGSQP